jgi:hypothetical protein
MKKIYSKVNPTILLHQINRLEEITEGRRDLSETKEFLQMSTLNLKNQKTFYPHKHIWKDGEKSVIAQESWIVIKGKVRCHFYDIDGTFIEWETLNPGDCSMTFQGGHNYTIEEDGTLVYEVKTGPYFGVEKDKVPI